MKHYPRLALIAALVLALLAVAGPARVAAQGTKSDSVVKFTTAADKPVDGKQVIKITMTVDKDWHAYANPAGTDDAVVGSQTKVTVEGKKPEEVQVEYPKGKEVKDPTIGTFYTYEGTVVIKATVPRGKDETGPLKVKVKFVCCNDKGSCLLPATVELSVP
jgi:DsbC/DsbD-like thiol-disulfide interchange protein